MFRALAAAAAFSVAALAADHRHALDATAPRGMADHAHAASTRPLPFFYDLYTFRGAHGTTVVAAFAVPAGALERESTRHGLRYRFDVSLVIADTASRAVSGTHDSVHVTLPQPLPGDHLIFTSVEMQTPPSTTTVHRVIMFDATRPGIGQLYTRPFPIPDYSGSELMLSDIALGQPGATDGWQRGDVTLALLPTSQFPSSAFDVYYEIYNLVEGSPYTTTLDVHEITQAGEPGERIVRVTFDDQARSSPRITVPELRRIESSLPPGRYRITATITDLSSRRTASRARTFEVRSDARGATMVPAMPVARGGARR